MTVYVTNDDMNFYLVYTVFLNLYILKTWDSRASYDLRQFWKEFESFAFVIDTNRPTSLFTVQRNTNHSFRASGHTSFKNL